MHGLISMFTVCTLVLGVQNEFLATTWKFRHCNACNKLSTIKYSCLGFFSVEKPLWFNSYKGPPSRPLSILGGHLREV